MNLLSMYFQHILLALLEIVTSVDCLDCPYDINNNAHITSPSSCLATVMKAIQVSKFGGTDELKVKDGLPIPKPQNTQVLIRVHAAGVNPVDTYLREGQYKALPSLPYVPGKDGAGVIEESNCDRFKKGDRVYFKTSHSGSYGEYTTVNNTEVFPLHSSVTFSQGAAIGIPYFTAYRALVHRCNIKAGESVLVHGASGAVGLAACQIARALGLKVYGTAGTQQGMHLVLDNGAHAVFNHREEGYIKKIMETTGGLDNIIEMLANVNLETDLGMMKTHGRIAVVGNRGSIEINPRQTMAAESTIHGVMLGQASQAEITETAAFLNAGQEAGWLRPHVGHEYTLEETAKAHEEVIAHSEGSKGKIVLKVP